MASFNKIMIIGYLGRDPELRHTPQGTPVCDFSLATTERRKDRSGGIQEVTTWFRVSLFGRQAEVASQYLTKGVDGQRGSYADKPGGSWDRCTVPDPGPGCRAGKGGRSAGCGGR